MSDTAQTPDTTVRQQSVAALLGAACSAVGLPALDTAGEYVMRTSPSDRHRRRVLTRFHRQLSQIGKLPEAAHVLVLQRAETAQRLVLSAGYPSVETVAAVRAVANHPQALTHYLSHRGTASIDHLTPPQLWELLALSFEELCRDTEVGARFRKEARLMGLPRPSYSLGEKSGNDIRIYGDSAKEASNG